MYTFNIYEVENHELNHFEADLNTIISLLRSLTSEHEMASKRKYTAFNVSFQPNLAYMLMM